MSDDRIIPFLILDFVFVGPIGLSIMLVAIAMGAAKVAITGNQFLVSLSVIVVHQLLKITK